MQAWKRCLLALLVSGAAHGAVDPAASVRDLTAPQIVAKNAEARGGVEAWHKIAAMAWAGRIESASQPNMSFVLEQKRPNKTRFELVFAQQKTTRIFDGNEGWKLKASAKSPRPELQPYTTVETTFARAAAVIDGPLMDFSARGYPMALEGQEELHGRKAYRLRAEMPSAQVQRVWVDAETFLELRLDRQTLDSGGRPTTVTVYFGNYKTFDGLQIPMNIETRSDKSNAVDRLVIERLALNPTLEDRLFSKPQPAAARAHGVVVDTRSVLQERAATGGVAP